MRGTLRHWSKKDYAFLKADYVYFPCMEPGRDGDVELREGRYWDVGSCIGISGSGGAGSSFCGWY